MSAAGPRPSITRAGAGVFSFDGSTSEAVAADAPAAAGNHDSIAGVLARLAESEPATVSISPVASTARSSETLTVSVVISEAVDLGAFEFKMGYSPAVVHVDGATLGAFLGSTGRIPGIPPALPEIDNEAGRLTFGAYSFGSEPGPSGGGVLCTITMTAQATGTSLLDLDALQVLQSNADPQDVVGEDGSVRVVDARYVYLPLFAKK